MSEVLLCLLFDGEPLVEVLDNGKYRTVSAGVNRARIDGTRLDVDSVALQLKLTIADHHAKLAACNPYANLAPSEVLAEIPSNLRRGMGARDVVTVLNAIQRIANRSIQ